MGEGATQRDYHSEGDWLEYVQCTFSMNMSTAFKNLWVFTLVYNSILKQTNYRSDLAKNVIFLQNLNQLDINKAWFETSKAIRVVL